MWVTNNARQIEKRVLFLVVNPTQLLRSEKEVLLDELRKSNRTLCNLRTKVLSVRERHFISFGITIVCCVNRSIREEVGILLNEIRSFLDDHTNIV